ncbi:unnamed protein product [Paramecium sonneborni]|uniref:Uncharacterized protein n=1 Tax=Paramecium sonneborni TaxID=65129 RepID=A0A8S1QWG6_9CILI|nr:unnamed protein product [Paramecium sonneborni]
MNHSNENCLSNRQLTNSKEYIIDKEVSSYNKSINFIEKIKIQIKFMSDQQIFYSQNGAILRVVQGHDFVDNPKMFNNMDQICDLEWQGQYSKNKKKEGKWIISWNKELLKNTGGQYKAGQKQGLWKDIFLNYWNQAQIIETGEYNKNLRIGKWNQISQGVRIGGGLYNKEGQKQGKWIDLDEGYYRDKKVTHIGEYDFNGKKVGRWDIMYCKHDEKKYKQFGGGSYDKEGNEKKIGKWVELDEGFYFCKQVTHNGEYNINGIKVGRWDIKYCKYDEQEYKKIQIIYKYKGKRNVYFGGGSYDQEGNQKKIGKWVELDEGFQYYKQVIHNGEYNMNGRKTGRWDIMQCKSYEGEYKLFGGGSYDQDGNQNKIGKWVELYQWFYCGEFESKYVTYNGEYNMNGMKIGRWDIRFAGGKYLQILYVQEEYQYIEVAENMIQKEIRKRLENGQSWLKGFNIINKSSIMVNII